MCAKAFSSFIRATIFLSNRFITKIIHTKSANIEMLRIGHKTINASNAQINEINVPKFCDIDAPKLFNALTALFILSIVSPEWLLVCQIIGRTIVLWYKSSLYLFAVSNAKFSSLTRAGPWKAHSINGKTKVAIAYGKRLCIIFSHHSCTITKDLPKRYGHKRDTARDADCISINIIAFFLEGT